MEGQSYPILKFWGPTISGFVVQWPKSNSRNSSRVVNRFFFPKYKDPSPIKEHLIDQNLLSFIIFSLITSNFNVLFFSSLHGIKGVLTCLLMLGQPKVRLPWLVFVGLSLLNRVVQILQKCSKVNPCILNMYALMSQHVLESTKF